MGKEFYDLEVWKKAHQLVLDVYKLTSSFPPEEKYGITSQLQRAVTSITANIAEGHSRYHFRDRIKFYYNARGSISEVQNFLIIARDLEFISENVFSQIFPRFDEVRKMLNGLIDHNSKMAEREE